MGQLRKALSKQNKTRNFSPPPGWERGDFENWWKSGPAYLSYHNHYGHQFGMVRYYGRCEYAIRELLRNEKINPYQILPHQLHRAMFVISEEVAKFGEATHCPICNVPFSSSVEHLVSHVTKVSEPADFGTYWEVPSGASGKKHFKFSPEVPENFKPRLIGIVAEYYAERVAYGGPAKRGIISAIFGA